MDSYGGEGRGEKRGERKMNSNMQDQLLKWAQDAVLAGKTYLPQLAQQYLTWKFWEASFFLSVGFLFIALAFVCLIIELKQPKEDRWDYDYSGGGLFRLIIMILGWSIGSIVAGMNLYTMIQIKIAPAVYIIDQFTGSR